MTTDPSPELDALYRRFTPSGIRQQQTRRALRVTLWRMTVRSADEVKRIVDMLIALTLLVPLAPLMGILRLMWGAPRRTPKLGRYCEPYDELTFDTAHVGRIGRALRLYRLPLLWNVARGDMSFIGPRAMFPGEITPRERAVRRRFDVRPGLVCLWWIRQRANIGYEGEAAADREYVDSASVMGDLGIALRAVPAALYGEAGTEAAKRVAGADGAEPRELDILGIRIDNVTMDEAVETLRKDIVEPSEDAQTKQVSFVNADCANIACRNPEYLELLSKRSDMTLADGIGLKLAGRILKRPIRQNVNGTDLFPMLLEAISGTGKGLYLLGAKPGIADGVADYVRANFPEVPIAGVRDGYFSKEEEPQVLAGIRDSGAALLLVAFGAPRQDQWVDAHLSEFGDNMRIAMGVGGLFDFYSGKKARAPQWVRELGLEWAFRLMLEPGRLWKRYVVGNGLFLMRVYSEKLFGRRAQ